MERPTQMGLLTSSRREMESPLAHIRGQIIRQMIWDLRPGRGMGLWFFCFTITLPHGQPPKDGARSHKKRMTPMAGLAFFPFLIVASWSMLLANPGIQGTREFAPH